MEEEQSRMAELFPHSLEVSLNAKKQYQWTIKVRFPAKDQIEAGKMAQTISDIDKELRTRLKDEVGK